MGRVDPTGASEALADLVLAVERGDSEAAVALAAPDDTGARDQLAAVADNADLLRVTDFSLRYVDEVSGAADGVWTAAVDSAWAFDGFDRDPARTEILVGFRLDDGAVRIDSLGGGDRRSPLWMTGPVTVRRSPGTLVLATGSPGRLDAYARAAEAAVPVVRRVLPGWRTGLVVEVPADLAQLGRALSVDPSAYAAIAAITTSPDGSLAPQAPAHVVLNREVYDALGPVESQVVMSHEAAHVATDAPSSLSPPWLLEGLADYVALRDLDLPDSVTAAQIIRQVRRQGPPARLPGSQEFGSGDTHLGAVYEAAWVACRVLADRGGQGALLRLYEQTSGDGRLQPAAAPGVRLDRARPGRGLAAAAGHNGSVSVGVASGVSGSVQDPAARTAWVTTLVGVLLLVVVAWWLVPWDPVPGGRLDAGPGRLRLQRRADRARRGLLPLGTGVGLGLPGGLAGVGVLVRLHPARTWRVRTAAGTLVAPGAAGRRAAVAGRPAGHAAVRGRVAAAVARLRPEHAVVGRLRPGPGGRRAGLDRRHQLGVLVLVACARRWRRAWPAVAGDPARGARRARLVRLPAADRAAVQLLRAAAGRCPAHARSSPSPTRRGCRSTTCSSPTPPVVRRRSTPTSRASAAPGGWSSTTPSSTACRRTRRSRWWPTSWLMPGTATC